MHSLVYEFISEDRQTMMCEDDVYVPFQWPMIATLFCSLHSHVFFLGHGGGIDLKHYLE